MEQKQKKIISRTTILVVVFIFLALKQVTFTFAIPPWQNHDEPAHFSYTQYLVEEKKIPVLESKKVLPKTLSFSEEYAASEQLIDATRLMKAHNNQLRLVKQRFQDDLFNYQNISTKLKGLSRHPFLLSNLPEKYDNLYYQYPSRDVYVNSAAPYQPLYYALEAIPYLMSYHQDIIVRMYAMRLFSNIFYLAAIFVCYLLAMRLTKNFKFSIALTLLIGLLPVFSHLMAGINNDALLIFLSTLTIYWNIRLVQKLSLSNTIYLGVTLGLGMLTKPQFIVFLPIIVIPLTYHFFKHKVSRPKLIGFGCLLILMVVLISGWWFAWSYQHYGSLFLQGESPPAGKVNISANTALVFHAFRYLYAFGSYNFAFGFATEMVLPLYLIALMIALFFLSVIGLVKYFYANKNKITSEDKAGYWVFLCAIIFLEILLSYLFTKELFATGRARFPIDGRYYLPVVFSLSFFYLLGLKSLLPERWQSAVYSLLIAIFLFINALSIFTVILPKFYL